MATAIGRTPLTLLTCQKVVVFFGTFVSDTGTNRAHYAHLSKVVVFFGKSWCTSKGYVERETSLASLERGGRLFRARFARLSKVVVFLANRDAPVRGM